MTQTHIIAAPSLARIISQRSLKKRVLCSSAGLLIILAAFLQGALAQNLPGPLNKPGGQLLYFFEDGTTDPARGEYAARLTVTNTHPAATVYLNFQFYLINSQGNWEEMFSYVDRMKAGQRHVLNPKGIRRCKDDQLVGFTTNGRFLLAVTPIIPPEQSSPIPDLRAFPFNWLLGTMEVRHLASSELWTLNAIARQAVDINGVLLNPPYPPPANDQTPYHLDGTNRLFQRFRPQVLSVNFFFPPAIVNQGPPLGNRLTLLAFRDEYENGWNTYMIRSGSATLSSFIFDSAANSSGVPQRMINSLGEFVIGSSASAAGNFPDFLGPTLQASFNRSGSGWLRMLVSPALDSNIVGWFSQSLGKVGGGDLLIAN